MKLKIVNVRKFIISIGIILGIIVGFTFLFSKATLSHGEVSYKTIYTSSGDTLWNIAKRERENNTYYDKEDIRDIIDSIKSVNHLENSELSSGQKLVIPYI